MNRVNSILLLLIFLVAGCKEQNQKETAENKKVWKEMDEFHTTLSGSFHPAESGQLQPVKDSASILLSRAQTWLQSEVPAGYNAAVVSPLITQLITQADTLRAHVERAEGDSSLTVEITRLHDIYHQIVEKCEENNGKKMDNHETHE